MQSRYIQARLVSAALFALLPGLALAGVSLKVGPHPAGGYVVATGQVVRPVGTSLTCDSRPTDMALSPDGKVLVVKDNRGLMTVNTKTWTLIAEAPFKTSGGSAHGLALTRDGSHVYATSANNELWEAALAADGRIAYERKITLPGPGDSKDAAACPWGVALSPDEKTAYVCLSRNNTLAVVDIETGTVRREIAVGVAPYDVVLDASGRTAYVTNWGGRRPRAGERSASTSGTQALVDERGVGASGTVSFVSLVTNAEIAQTPTGLHPSDLKLSANGRTLYTANANSDTISVIDVSSRRVTETIAVRPKAGALFGSAPTSIALSSDGRTMYAANGGNNAIAVVALRTGKAKSRLVGFIPTAWYPGSVIEREGVLYVANTKGYGTRGGDTNSKKWQIYQPLGVLTRVRVPNAATLATYTARVHTNARLTPGSLKQTEGRKPVPVPAVTGAPSVFQHVVYIIKENKTYDQVLGDLPRGNSDASLCVFPRETSPNHHALAEQFVLLDNFYCNGVCSADGHSWTDEGYATDFLEKSFGGFTRSYPFGDDCLNTSSSGFLWDNALAHGRTFRNYGEMDYAELPAGATWKSLYDSLTRHEPAPEFAQNIGVERLRRYSCRQYPGWNMNIPDAIRADAFLKELEVFNATGGFPNLVIIYLPNDHTSGGTPGSPTPRAQVADNDLALGRVVEGISRSRFWPKTCIFVVEDDPQSGFDHVDGHRSFCFVASPYTRRGALVSEFYNQTSVLHTMERILGLPPMNQIDANSPLMTACFTDKPDLRPYTCLPNRVPLDEMSSPTAAYYGKARLAAGQRETAFDRPDRIDDDELNRVIWHSVRGYAAAYPSWYAGAHGTGLARLHLALAPAGDVEEDDD